jgi:MOSC domain-containing protein YiiM
VTGPPSPAQGRVLGLCYRPGRDRPAVCVDHAEATVEAGFAPDHGRTLARGVTLLEARRWARAASAAGVPDLSWTARRANVLVDGLDLMALLGRHLRVGAFVVEVLGETAPCEVMDLAQPGLRRALEGGGGGVHGRVVVPGTVRVGDEVVLLPDPRTRGEGV